MSISTAIGGVVLELPADDTAPSLARAAVRERFGGAIPASALETVILVTSEIVSNTVVHAGLAPGQTMRLRLCDGGDRVGIEVTDEGDGFALGGLGGSRHGGRGLRLIAMLSRRWGITCDDGTTTWAEVATR